MHLENSVLYLSAEDFYIMKTNKLFSLAVPLIALTLASCQPAQQKDTVVATLFVHYDLTRTLLTGTDVEVIFPLSSGQDPHDWEPTVRDTISLYNADLLIYTGLEFEPWVDAIIEQPEFKGELLDLSSYVVLLEGHEHEDEEEEDHDEEGYDPHYWLDPYNAFLMVGAIQEVLIDIYPQYQSVIEGNALELETNILELVELYSSLLEDNHHEEETYEDEEDHDHVTLIFAGHNAFGYLENYGIEFVSPYSGFSSSTMPSPLAIATLVLLINQLDTSYIYASELEGTAVADALLENIPGLEILTLATLENVTDVQRDTMTYVDFMQQNYEALLLGVHHD